MHSFSAPASHPGKIPLKLVLAACFAHMALVTQAAPGLPVEGVPADLQADFSVQGEYSGFARLAGVPDKPVGAQVAALGDGDFKVMLYPGGLPGEGSDGGLRFQAEGKSGAEGTVIEGDAYRGRIRGDTLSGSDSAGDSLVLVKRVRVSPTLGLPPPPGATVLFGGASAEAWTNASVNAEGLFEPLEREAVTRKKFADFSLHVEFRLPFLPFAFDQSRANSGVRFLDETHLFTEIQTLDSFAGDTGTNEGGGLEGLYPADIPASFPPMAWQTYDIQVTTPQEVDSTGLGQARMTVWQNGILIHPARVLPFMAKSVNIALQSLDSAGGFRNIWIVEGDDRYPFLPGMALRPAAKASRTPARAAVRIGSNAADKGFSVRIQLPGGAFRPNGAKAGAGSPGN